MKRFIALVLFATLSIGFTGCGASNNATSSFTAADYASIITENRHQSDNDVYTVFALENGTFTATSGVSSELDSDAINQQAQLTLDMLGCQPDDIEKAAFSVSLMNIKSYGIAIIQPAAGKSDAVKQALTTFIESQKASQENYLAEQYAIAKASRLETLKNGEIVLVMCADQDTIFHNIKNALK